MKELVEYIVKNLVIDEQSVQVSMTEDDGETVIHVFVAPDDMGRVIGKAGKVVSSIRTIVNSLALREHKRVSVKIGE